METGDILLFESNFEGLFGWWAYIVSFVTRSKYTHVAMILKDPIYIDETYIGTYVIESGSEKWEKKWGTIISPLEKVLKGNGHKHIYWRRLCIEEDINEMMPVIYKTVMHKEYDVNIFELIGNELKSEYLANPRELNKFVCSSLVGYMYTVLGLLPENTKWFFMQPKDFSYEQNPELKLIDCKLEPEICIS